MTCQRVIVDDVYAVLALIGWLILLVMWSVMLPPILSALEWIGRFIGGNWADIFISFHNRVTNQLGAGVHECIIRMISNRSGQPCHCWMHSNSLWKCSMTSKSMNKIGSCIPHQFTCSILSLLTMILLGLLLCWTLHKKQAKLIDPWSLKIFMHTKESNHMAFYLTL